MGHIRSSQLCTLIASAVAVVLFSATVSAQNSSDQLPRFHQVSERLYRGGQPRAGGLQRLRELGIDTIINLRGRSNGTTAEEAEARALGFNYFNLSLPNWGRPPEEGVREILLVIAAPQNGRVFVHCKDGVDRTGTIVALHRVTHQGWTTNDALTEADRLGMRRIQLWMRDYTEDYASRVHSYQAAHQNFGDHLGAGIRIAEREAFRARKKIHKFLSRVF